MATSSISPALSIDNSDAITARTVSIVFLTLAAVLPVIMVISLVSFYKYRTFKKKRKQFAEEWNLERLDSHRTKQTSRDQPVDISRISSNDLDSRPTTANHATTQNQREKNTRQKKVSISGPEVTGFQYFNSAYLDDSSTENGTNKIATDLIKSSNETRPQVSLSSLPHHRDKLQFDDQLKPLSTDYHSPSSIIRNSAYKTNSTKDCDVEDADGQLRNSQRGRQTSSSIADEYFSHDSDKNIGILNSENKAGNSNLKEDYQRFSVDDRREQNLVKLRDSLERKKQKDEMRFNNTNIDPNREFGQSKLPRNPPHSEWSPTSYEGSIEWVGGDENVVSNGNKPFSKPMLNIIDFQKREKSPSNSEVFFQTPAHSPIASPRRQRNENLWQEEIDHLDYFASPVPSKRENFYRYGGRVSNASTPKSNTRVNDMPRTAVIYDSRERQIDGDNQHSSSVLDYQKVKSNLNGQYYPKSDEFLRNPLYEEQSDDNYDRFRSKNFRDNSKALEYYKNHGSLSSTSGFTDDTTSPKLHRYPGRLDLNKIVESSPTHTPGSLRNYDVWGETIYERLPDEKMVNVGQFDEKRLILNSDIILPPPPTFSDPIMLPLKKNPRILTSNIEPGIQVPLRPFKPHPIPKPRRNAESYQDHNFPTNQPRNVLKTADARSLSNQYHPELIDQTSGRSNSSIANDLFRGNNILKEEEEKALKYFEDICKELGYDSLNGSDDSNGDKQTTSSAPKLKSGFGKQHESDAPVSVGSNHPTTTRYSRPSDLATQRTAENTPDSPLRNFRKSYEHLLSPDYPYQRRLQINSEYASNRSSAEASATGIASADTSSNRFTNSKSRFEDPSDRQQASSRAWIITKM